jgi:hypothetical protein
MPYDFDLDGYVMLPLPDKLSHMVHDYNADTLLAGKKPEDYPPFSISLNVDNELDKPEILSFLSLSPSKVLSEEYLSIRNQCISRLLLTLSYYRNIVSARYTSTTTSTNCH